MNLFEIEGAPILNLRAWLAASGVYTIAYLAGAALFWMLRLTKGRTCGFEFLLLRLSAGLAVTPLIVLAAGQVPGLLWQIPWWIAALGGGALLVYDAARLLRRIIQENRGRRFSNFLSAAGWIGVFLTLFALVGPAFSPPINYDALEYHLGVIPHYFETKSITPIPHVFYSAQPLATEMLYTLGAVAERTPWGWSAGLVNWMMILLLAALTAQVLKAIGAPQAMIPWLLIVLLTHPIILKLELDRLSDLMGAIFMLAGLLVLSPKETHTHHPGGLDDNLPSPLRHGGWPGPPSERAPKVAQPRWDSRFKPSQDFSDTLSRGLLILAGIFAGAALSAKWTNAGTAVTILTAAYISWLIPAKSNRQALDGDTEQKADVPPPPPARILSLAFSQLAMFMLGLVLIIFPWMIWLWFRAGNPLAPFAARLFPTPAWSAERLEFLLFTHGPLSFFSPTYWVNLFRRLVSFQTGPPLLVISCVLCLASLICKSCAREKRAMVFHEVLPLFAGTCISLLFWGRLAQAADRFLAPVIAVSLVILGTSLKIFFLSPDSSRSRALRWFAIGLALLALPSWGGQFSLLKSMPYWDCALGKITPREYLRATLGGTAELFEEANRLPTGSRILAIGEARRYYFTTLLSLSSVFDDHPIREFVSGAPDAEAIRARIAKAGYTHLLVNEYEIARLLDFHPPKALLDDKNFVALRSKGPEGYAPLIERYSGYIEFGPQPLTADEGRIYLDFLNLMRADAPFLRSGTNPHPAFWIAPISRAE